MWIEWREHQRQRPRPTERTFVRNRRRHLLDLFVAQVLPLHKSAEDHAGILRIRRDVTIFITGDKRTPIVKIQEAVSARARGCRRPAILLRSIHPIRKLIVGGHMIELPGGLVKPRAPGLASRVRYECAL